MDDVGNVVVTKTPSTPRDPAQAVERGVSLLAERLGLSATGLMRRCTLVVHGTTVATNALLERRGARTALLTTAGFRDLLEMREGSKTTGRYDLSLPPPAPLTPRHLRLPVPERVRYTGQVETALDWPSLSKNLDRLEEEQVEAAAVCLLHSTANPEHERLVGRTLSERFPGMYVCLSHQVLPQVGEYDRLSTTVVNAYVGPVLSTYLEGLRKSLARLGYQGDVLVMQSHGGVLPAPSASELAAGAVLSGPAGGVYGSVFYGELLGLKDLVSLDMGGTSTDIALISEGAPATVSQREIDGVRVALPGLAVHTLGAGGGSIVELGPDGLPQVGPQSAGAEPGPACYGRGGARPTVTDANLLLGYLDPNRFLGGAMPLSPDAAQAALERHVTRQLHQDAAEAAYGVYRLVNVQMAEGIRVVTVRQGRDPRRFTLLAGGGAAGLHAVALARELGIPRVVVPRLSPVLSALGLLAADVRYELVQACAGELGAMAVARPQQIAERLMKQGQHRLAMAGVPEENRVLNLSADLVYANQVHALTVPLRKADLHRPDQLRARFQDSHQTRYGYCQPDDQPVRMRALRLAAVGRLVRPGLLNHLPSQETPGGNGQDAALSGERAIYLGEWVQATVLRLEGLSPGERLCGPAVIGGDYTTILLPPGCEAQVDPWGGLSIDVH
jgi:N-methylhydantoinase A